MDELPLDVIHRIADRLPFKSLVRFRCARKEWYADPLLKSCMTKFVEKPTIMSLDIEGRRSDIPRFEVEIERNLVKAWIPQLADPVQPRLMGTCNGLVCFYQDYAPGFLVLVNPLLEEVLSVSTSPMPPPEGYLTNTKKGKRKAQLEWAPHIDIWGYGWDASGLGLDHASGAYKLVVFSHRDDEAVLVFDLSARLWWEISRPSSWHWIPTGVGVFLHGALYWHRWSHSIVSFDVAKEDFGELQCPISISTLFDLGSHLGVAGFNRSTGHIEIWEHNLHGKEWTSKYNIDAPGSYYYKIVGAQNQMILLRTDRTLYSYNPRSRKFECIRPARPTVELIFCLEGSQVSLSRFNQPERCIEK